MKLSFVVLCFCLFGCSTHQPNESADWPSESLFHLDSTWIRQDGKEVSLSSLSDSPKIVSMVFLRCAYSCPLTVQDMKTMEKRLDAKIKAQGSHKKYGLVLISIDPDHDTPEAMRKFAMDRKLDLSRWTLLTSDAQNIRELAAALGFSYKKDEAMQFAHSMLTWVVDEKGLVRFVRSGRRQSIEETIGAID